MNLLFAINKNFIPLFSSCIHSVLRNGGYDSYDAYFLHSDLDTEDKQQIQEAAGNRVQCHFIDLDPSYFEGFPTTKRYPLQIYYRLAAPLLLPRDLDRILYLDVDLLVINSLKDLYELDFEGNYYAACTHVKKILTKINQKRLGTQKEVPYINTGVLLMNLSALRPVLSIQSIREYANEKMATFILPDQDILTALYGERIKLLDTMKYNLNDTLMLSNNINLAKERIDLDWVRENTVIVHYCGKNKPWNENYFGVLDQFWTENEESRQQ